MRIPEQIGGVEGCYEFTSAIGDKPTPETGYPFIGFKQCLSGEGAEGTDNFRLDYLELLNEKRFTCFNLIRFGVPVLWGAAFDDVGDVNFFPGEIDRIDDFGE